jgi:hypothetical protein
MPGSRPGMTATRLGNCWVAGYLQVR